MPVASYFISSNELWNLIGTAESPQIVDVRRRDAYDGSPGVLPTASWHDAKTATGSDRSTAPVPSSWRAKPPTK